MLHKSKLAYAWLKLAFTTFFFSLKATCTPSCGLKARMAARSEMTTSVVPMKLYPNVSTQLQVSMSLSIAPFTQRSCSSPMEIVFCRWIRYPCRIAKVAESSCNCAHADAHHGHRRCNGQLQHCIRCCYPTCPIGTIHSCHPTQKHLYSWKSCRLGGLLLSR